MVKITEGLGPISTSEIANAPNIDDALPPTIPVLNTLLEQRPNDFALHFALGNLFLVSGETGEAIESFKNALSIDNSALVRCNLGVALRISARFDEATSEFSQAILLDANHLLSHYHLGKTHYLKENVRGAQSQFEKAIRLDPSFVPAIVALAICYAQQGEYEKARTEFEKAYTADPNNREAAHWLAEDSFESNIDILKDEGIAAAAAHWKNIYSLYPGAFHASKKIQQGLRTIAEERMIRGYLREAERQLETQDCEEKKLSAYMYTLELLLSLRLLPELFEPLESLEERNTSLEKDLSADRVFPHVHYRHGIILLYLGEFSTAYEELLFAKDHLPGSKMSSLKISQLLQAIRELSGEATLLAEEEQDDDAAWSNAGFPEAFSRELWRKVGLRPNVAFDWREAKFSPRSAVGWLAEGFSSVEARQWNEDGITQPRIAGRYLRAQFASDQAAEWHAAFPENCERAIEAKRVGFRSADEAKKWLKLFMFASEAWPWIELGIELEEAEIFLENGVGDPFKAKRLKEEHARKKAADRDAVDEETESES